MDKYNASLKSLLFGAKVPKNDKTNLKSKATENPMMETANSSQTIVSKKKASKRKIDSPAGLRKRTKVKNEVTPDKDNTFVSADNIEIKFFSSSGVVAENKPKKRRKKQSLTERANLARNKHKIHVWGTDIPEPCISFETLSSRYDVPEIILNNFKNLGFTQPTPIQMQAIPIMLKSRELLASAPTGSGKTLAFALPVFATLLNSKDKEGQPLSPRAIILEPTRELAKQTYNELLRFGEGVGVRVQLLEKMKSSSLAVKNLHKKYDIIVTTPNRLIFDMQAEPSRVRLTQVEWLIVDESDKLFEAGDKGFRDQLATIYVACESSLVRRAFFSATFSCDVESWCKNNLDNLIRIGVGPRNSAVESVRQELFFVGTESGKMSRMRTILAEGLQPPVLIFVQSRDRAQQLLEELGQLQPNRVAAIHSQMHIDKREETINKFRGGDVWFLIATELLGRGLDFKAVNVVINWDFPTSAVSYIHRIGRTGRAGRIGRAMTFFTEQDKPLLRSIAILMKDAGCPVPDYMLQLNKPNKKLKKKLAKHAPKRERISKNEKYSKKKRKSRSKVKTENPEQK